MLTQLAYEQNFSTSTDVNTCGDTLHSILADTCRQGRRLVKKTTICLDDYI